jgi:lysophospholipase L1-like esterase
LKDRDMMKRRSALTVIALAPFAAVAQENREAQRTEEDRIHNDWPFLARYRDANRKLAAGTAQVVFMGDSITEGWSDKTPSAFSSGRVNRGIGGQTTPQMLVRFRQDVVELKPQVVHIMAGTNDIAGNTGPASLEMIQANFMSMVDIARSNGIAVIVASIPPASRFPWKPSVETVRTIATMNAWVRKYAADRGATYADYDAVLNDGAGGIRKGLAYDGVHPTAEGYAAMNPVAEQAIQAALAKH